MAAATGVASTAPTSGREDAECGMTMNDGRVDAEMGVALLVTLIE